MRVRVLVVAAIAAVCVAMAAGSAGAEGDVYSGYFKTPSGSVYCDYLYGSHIVAKYRYVRCGFKGQLSPPEPKPKGGCPNGTDYVGNRMILMQKGRGKAQPCSGDAGPFGNPKAAFVVPYGHTWSGGGFTCKPSQHGMTCKSKDGHGFRLFKSGWRVF